MASQYEAKESLAICADLREDEQFKNHSLLCIRGARLPYTNPQQADTLWDITCWGGRVRKIEPHDSGDFPGSLYPLSSVLEANGGLLMPSLCHPHIHLDKCFILDQCEPLITGTFDEAMRVTANAKKTFRLDPNNLRDRARKLIKESVECGVTSMRAHVEVDSIVELTSIQIAKELSLEWMHACDVQISAFMQEAIFEKPEDFKPGRNWEYLVEAASTQGVYCVGSAPYVEPSLTLAKRNIDLVLDLAQKTERHVDFHLDYNLDAESEPLIFYVIDRVRRTKWGGIAASWPGEVVRSMRHVTIGHCTRACLFNPTQWRLIKEAIGGLPISIVGLPQSDIYMMGRNMMHKMLGAPRSTLRVPQIAKEHGIKIAMGINNVFNAFTPQGDLDPLTLTSFAAGVFQAATLDAVQILAESVTLTAKRALGEIKDDYLRVSGLVPQDWDPADFVILHGAHSLQRAILSPTYERVTLRAGRVVATRKAYAWNDVDAYDRGPVGWGANMPAIWEEIHAVSDRYTKAELLLFYCRSPGSFFADILHGNVRARKRGYKGDKPPNRKDMGERWIFRPGWYNIEEADRHGMHN